MNPYISTVPVKHVDFKINRRCQPFSLLGRSYTAFTQYFPTRESVNPNQTVIIVNKKAFLYIVQGSYNGMSKEFINFWRDGQIPKKIELEACMSTTGEGYCDVLNNSLFVKNVLSENQGLIDLLMDTVIHLYTNRGRDTSISYLRVGSPKHLISKDLLSRHGLTCPDNDTLTPKRGYVAPATVLTILNFAKN